MMIYQHFQNMQRSKICLALCQPFQVDGFKKKVLSYTKWNELNEKWPFISFQYIGMEYTEWL